MHFRSHRLRQFHRRTEGRDIAGIDIPGGEFVEIFRSDAKNDVLFLVRSQTPGIDFGWQRQGSAVEQGGETVPVTA
ncbi:hypothetical protein D3C86_2100870 [compost metagenome]